MSVIPLIREFSGDFRFLSNFWRSDVEYGGITYPTAEHAYQAQKTMDEKERKRIAGLRTPADAKRAGQKLKLRPNWEKDKISVMEAIVYAKFEQSEDLQKRLLDTFNAELEEGNNWGDKFWGVVGGFGRNELGKILMRVRERIKANHG
jgi:ribA/ribD-fused uncharacterized protein